MTGGYLAAGPWRQLSGDRWLLVICPWCQGTVVSDGTGVADHNRMRPDVTVGRSTWQPCVAPLFEQALMGEVPPCGVWAVRVALYQELRRQVERGRRAARFSAMTGAAILGGAK